MADNISERNGSLDYVQIRDGKLYRNGALLAEYTVADLAELYQKLGLSYIKFFKMDGLCKLAWLAAEVLLNDEGRLLYSGLDKSKIAVVLTSRDGCLDVDRRYSESIREIPSPALFVYTLPNIMLGEISIRHGFTGEQLCLLSDDFDVEEMIFHVKDLLESREFNHCLFGKVDAAGDLQEAILFWVNADTVSSLSVDKIQSLINAVPDKN